MTECTARGTVPATETPPVAQQHSPMVPHADPTTPINHTFPETHLKPETPSNHAIHQFQHIMLMLQGVEGLQEKGTAGWSLVEVVYETIATSPGELDMDNVINPIYPGMPYSRLGQRSQMWFRFMENHIHEFTGLAVQLGFTRGVFTLDLDHDLEGILITQGWTVYSSQLHQHVVFLPGVTSCLHGSLLASSPSSRSVPTMGRACHSQH